MRTISIYQIHSSIDIFNLFFMEYSQYLTIIINLFNIRILHFNIYYI